MPDLIFHLTDILSYAIVFCKWETGLSHRGRPAYDLSASVVTGAAMNCISPTKGMRLILHPSGNLSTEDQRYWP